MSISDILGLSGVSSLPLNPTAAVTPVPAVASIASASADASSTRPMLLVPTKPPLTNAVLAELMGHQSPNSG